MSNALRDIRYGLRTLVRTPSFTAVAILSIAIGIAANVTTFSWMRSMLLDPLPGATQPQRVVVIENQAENSQPITSSYLDFCDYRDHLRLLRDVTAVQPWGVFSVGNSTRTDKVPGELVSGNFFHMLGVKPQAGRFFSTAERDDAQNAHPVVIISDGYWKAHFHADPRVIGSTLRVNRTPLTIIGIAPPAFNGSRAGLASAMWIPLTMYGQLTHTGTWMLNDRNTRNFVLYGRLVRGASIAQARSEVQGLANRMAIADADTNQGVAATVLPVWKSHYGTQDSLLTPIAILMGASGLVLLIVCANLANLILARATTRQKELSIRLALGAGAIHIFKTLLIEILLIAVFGSVCGLMLASWLGGALRWFLPALARPAMIAPPIDLEIFAFTAALAIVVVALSGFAPLLQAMRGNVTEMAQNGGRGAASRSAHSHRLRGLLVTSEVALAAVALVGAGLFLKSFESARAIHPGFVPEGMAVAHFDFSSAGYNARQTDSFCRRLRDRLERQPGVTAVSYDDSPPLGFQGGNWEGLDVQGYVPRRDENMKIYRDLVSPGFFKSMKIPLLDGRDFDLRDDAKSEKVAIVNQEFLRRFFRNQNPLGRKIRGWGQSFTIIGVAAQSKYHEATEAPQPYFYAPIRQIFRPEYGLTFEVRATGSLAEVVSAVRRETAAIDPALTIFDAGPMTEYIAGSMFGAKIAASLLAVLSSLGLLLAAIGLYSVMAYSVAQRTGEIGIRVALGARRDNIMGLVLRQGMMFAVPGLLLGCFVAASVARLASTMLVAVSPSDPLVYAAAALFILIVTLAAAIVPAWRALRVDPIVALRVS